MKVKKMDIIYEDKEFLVVNKPSGLLTISTDKEVFRTIYHEAREYVKKQNPKNKIFIVHRLDRDTSGVVVFVKNEKLKHLLQDNWEKATKREYIAIVCGCVKDKSGTLKSYLKEDRTFRVYSTNDKSGALAITHYEVLESTKAYSLLRIKIDTGKKNQIRVQLSDFGHPIVGDKKYGSSKNPMGRMGLHAYSLELKFLDYSFKWKANIPECFKKMFASSIEEYEKRD